MKTILIAVVACAFAMPAMAGSLNCRTINSETFCNGDNGYSSEQRSYGSSSFGTDNRGNGWSTQDYGNGNSYTFNRNSRDW